MNAFSANAATLCAAFCFSALHAVAQAPSPGPAAPARDAKPANAPAPAPVTSTPSALPATTPSAGALFAAIGNKPAIVYDAPSAKAQKTFILSRLHPVEVLVKLEKWVKIRDADNTIGWVESVSLGTTRAVQVSANTAEIRAMPNPNATIVFEALRQVVLETTGPAVNGWIPVRHRDGQTGYVSKSQVWGE
jgi:SH3-like domain-containing protein